MTPTPKMELERRLGIAFDPAPLLVTYHSETLEVASIGEHVEALMQALESMRRPIVFSYPGADTAAGTIVTAIEAFVRRHTNAVVVKNFGTADYYGMMAAAAIMVGNSSSGIIEAPSFALPVVNIGNRQRGRLRAANVIDCPPEYHAISAAIARALNPSFRDGLKGLRNPYGDGRAAERIIGALSSVPLAASLVEKRFFDLPAIEDAVRVADSNQ